LLSNPLKKKRKNNNNNNKRKKEGMAKTCQKCDWRYVFKTSDVNLSLLALFIGALKKTTEDKQVT